MAGGVGATRRFPMTADPIVGLHHVTAIASEPQMNLDFYTRVLGLRLVKRTVNFDDPGTYHLYFGDDLGAPGTLLTFFPWPRAGRGTPGAGEVTHVAFLIPLDSLSFWEQRLASKGIPFSRGPRRFNEEVLSLSDPAGMQIELTAQAGVATGHPPRFSDVPSGHAIRGLSGVTMLQLDATETSGILSVMGFHQIAAEGQRLRFASSAHPTALGSHIDMVVDPQANFGRSGAGSVHHIAFRVANDAAQMDWRSVITQRLAATEVLDRKYFHSIYFREPGGVLFELATDQPGFAVDEPVETLGESLCLPTWLEFRREGLQQRLPSITLHKGGAEANPAADPHASGELYRAGAALTEAAGVVILLHGRGGPARDILTLSRALAPGRIPLAFLAPQAAGLAWYPNSFLAERELNQPHLDSALARVQATADLALAAGIPRERIVLAGFSQGACLAVEFIASHPARYAGLIAWTGGLIGPPGSTLTQEGELHGTPALFAGSDPDQWVPWTRVQESARIFTAMGAQVELRGFPGKPHSVSGEEIELARQLIERAFAGAQAKG